MFKNYPTGISFFLIDELKFASYHFRSFCHYSDKWDHVIVKLFDDVYAELTLRRAEVGHLI